MIRLSERDRKRERAKSSKETEQQVDDRTAKIHKSLTLMDKCSSVV